MTFTAQSKGSKFVEGLTKEISSKSLIFPTSLNITMRIRRALGDPDASTNDIARIVGSEPVLSGQLLRLSNSVVFGAGSKPISDVRNAITRLGFSMVRNVAISVGMQQLKQSKASGAAPPVIDALWKRSVRISALSYVLTRRLTRLNPDTAMLAGLLHDIGKFYILNRARDYTELFSDENALWEIVDQWHVDIGQAILESWEIPEEISAAVRNFRDAGRTHIGPPDISDIVAVADFLDTLSYPSRSPKSVSELPKQSLDRLKLDQEKIESLLEEAKKELALILTAIGG
jgi:putative nucleotidyltransferase with HDIG domain